MCEILLRNGAETMYRDEKGRTLLHVGVLASVDKKLMQLILDYKKVQDGQQQHENDAINDPNKGIVFDKPPKAKRQLNIENLRQLTIQRQQLAPEEEKHNSSSSLCSDRSQRSQALHQLQIENQISNEDEKKLQFEQKLKSSPKYKKNIQKFINAVDKKGRTPLHLAA